MKNTFDTVLGERIKDIYIHPNELFLEVEKFEKDLNDLKNKFLNLKTKIENKNVDYILKVNQMLKYAKEVKNDIYNYIKNNRKIDPITGESTYSNDVYNKMFYIFNLNVHQYLLDIHNMLENEKEEKLANSSHSLFLFNKKYAVNETLKRIDITNSYYDSKSEYLYIRTNHHHDDYTHYRVFGLLFVTEDGTQLIKQIENKEDNLYVDVYNLKYLDVRTKRYKQTVVIDASKYKSNCPHIDIHTTITNHKNSTINLTDFSMKDLIVLENEKDSFYNPNITNERSNKKQIIFSFCDI